MNQTQKNYTKWLISTLNVLVSLRDTNQLFPKLLESCRTYTGTKSNILTLADIKRMSNRKIVGDLFEILTKAYVLTVKLPKIKVALTSVWLFSELTTDIRELLGLGTQDLGIDLVGCYNDTKSNKDRYIAIQSKYRTPSKRKPTYGIGWKQLSTFSGLCARSGPKGPNKWSYHVVVTNANYIHHPNGKKLRKDISVCKRSWEKLDRFHWLNIIRSLEEMCQLKPSEQQNAPPNKKPDIDLIRKKRLERFNS